MWQCHYTFRPRISVTSYFKKDVERQFVHSLFSQSVWHLRQSCPRRFSDTSRLVKQEIS